MDKSIYTSAYYSLFVQFIIGIICLGGIFLKLDNNDKILNEILILETIVQSIEFIFYIWLVFNFSNISTTAIKDIPIPNELDKDLVGEISEMSRKLTDGKLIYEGEIRFGPAFYSLKIDGSKINGRIFEFI